MEIVTLSDTHSRHKKIKVPGGDVLIHAGDMTMAGGSIEFTRFADWFLDQPHEHKIMVPGNHDWGFVESNWLFREIAGDVTVLIDQAHTIDGVKFYGAPWQPEFNNWAFNLPRGKALAKKWQQIPTDTQVLITHGPPHGILDEVPPFGRNLGCEDLKEALKRVKPRLHVFGHIHESYGRKETKNTTYINTSICDGDYQPTNAPQVFDLKI